MHILYRLTVAFCVVDETEILVKTFHKIKQGFEPFEFIFVLSQTSTEESREIVDNICKYYDNCSYCFQDGRGLGNAIKKAIDYSNGTHLLIWPSDDGMDSTSYPQMVEYSMNNPGKIIKVSRWLRHGDFVNYGKIRLAINYISQKLFAALYSANLTDFTNPTQIAPIDVYREIKWENDDFGLIPELIFRPLKAGYEFCEIPCTNTEQRRGKGNSKLSQLIKYYFVIIKIRFEK